LLISAGKGFVLLVLIVPSSVSSKELWLYNR